MRRLILAAALWPLMTPAAHAACPATLADCPTVNANDGNFGGKLKARSMVWLSAVDYGVKADAVVHPTTGVFVSGTPDDVPLKAALDDCAAKNAILFLPPRAILIDGSGPTAMIENCRIESHAQHGGIYAADKRGTMILLRSKTRDPFHIRSDWSMRGVAFFHPDQVGAGATFTGSASGTTLTVSGVSQVGIAGGGIFPGYLLAGARLSYGTTIVSQISGTTGGNGTYAISKPVVATNVAMAAMKPLVQYPAVLSDDGSVGASHFVLDDVTFINPWDAIKGTPGVGWGGFFMRAVTAWAIHDAFAFGYLGDTPHVNSLQMSPGPWFGMTGATAATKMALNWAQQQNTIFHVQATNLPWQVSLDQMGVMGFRYMFKVDNTNVNFTQSLITVAGDASGTVLSVPEGSAFHGFNTVIRGSAACVTVDWFSGANYGNANCFEISSTSSLILSGFLGTANGNTVTTNGGSVQIQGGQYSAGGFADGTDYAVVKLTANVGRVEMHNMVMAGVSCGQDAVGCRHVRGLDTNGFQITFAEVQGNVFSYFENDIKLDTSPGSTLVQNNQDFGLSGYSNSMLFAGLNRVTWSGNKLQSPLTPALGPCGTGSSIHGGSLRGYVNVGTGPVVTECTLTMLFAPDSAVVSAWTADGTLLAAQQTAQNVVKIIAIGGITDLAGKSIFFDWRGWE
jgi:hypothetical protein